MKKGENKKPETAPCKIRVLSLELCTYDNEMGKRIALALTDGFEMMCPPVFIGLGGARNFNIEPIWPHFLVLLKKDLRPKPKSWRKEIQMSFNVYFSRTDSNDAKAHITRLISLREVKKQLQEGGYQRREEVVGFISVGGSSGTKFQDLLASEGELRFLEEILTEAWRTGAVHGASTMAEKTIEHELSQLRENL